MLFEKYFEKDGKKPPLEDVGELKDAFEQYLAHLHQIEWLEEKLKDTKDSTEYWHEKLLRLMRIAYKEGKLDFE